MRAWTSSSLATLGATCATYVPTSARRIHSTVVLHTDRRRPDADSDVAPVPLGVHASSEARVHAVSGASFPDWLDEPHDSDWAFGGGAKSRSGPPDDGSVLRTPVPHGETAGAAFSSPRPVYGVDGANLWEHMPQLTSSNAAPQPPPASPSAPAPTPGPPGQVFTYSGPTSSVPASPFDPTPGVPRLTPWRSPAPMESESDLLGQRRAQKQRFVSGTYQSPARAAGITGSAGTGAVPNYGRKNRIRHPADAGSSTSVNATPALPQRTMFASPSSSFNANNLASLGSDPPLERVLTAAGLAEYAASGTPKRKRTALIFPGLLGSQYVGMGRNLFRNFKEARQVWQAAEQALYVSATEPGEPFWITGSAFRDRANVPLSEEELLLEQQRRQHFLRHLEAAEQVDAVRDAGPSKLPTGPEPVEGGWLRQLVFGGDQLALTRPENAAPATLACTMAFFNVLRTAFPTDLVADHIDILCGHGTGTYAALVAAGHASLTDVVRLLRHQGLVTEQCWRDDPLLFPPGCQRPENDYATWGFTNAGAEPATGYRQSLMTAMMIRTGMLHAALLRIEELRTHIHLGDVRIEEVQSDGVVTEADLDPNELVEIAQYNSHFQIVLSGTRRGVDYVCDVLQRERLGHRAVNLPVAGPYGTSLLRTADDAVQPAIRAFPLREVPPNLGTERGTRPNLTLISGYDGDPTTSGRAVRWEMQGALSRPVRWFDTLDRLLERGVERFICLGPGRAVGHLLSKELAHRQRVEASVAKRGVGEVHVATAAGYDAPRTPAHYEVWSVASTEDVRQLGGVLSRLSESERGAA